jgi:hypothetical protein
MFEPRGLGFAAEVPDDRASARCTARGGRLPNWHTSIVTGVAAR